MQLAVGNETDRVSAGVADGDSGVERVRRPIQRAMSCRPAVSGIISSRGRHDFRRRDIFENAEFRLLM